LLSGWLSPARRRYLNLQCGNGVWTSRQGRGDYRGFRGLRLELADNSPERHVVLLARQREQLAEVARELESIGARVTVLQCDVTKKPSTG
jgi:hypothetical protein